MDDAATTPGKARANWRALLDELGVRPSKALGQNFLHDPGIVGRIAEAAELSPDDTVVEIGPGLGILTRELSRRAGRVIAVELDRRLAAYLRTVGFPATTSIVESDILQADVASLTGGHPYVVVANLPYSVAAAAIEHLLESPARPTRLIVMVQREVADRIVARPPEMSLLAVAVQLFGRPRVVFRIGPGAFIPPPKVESAVLRIDVYPELPLSHAELPSFFRIVRAGFAQRRKRLANALAAGLGLAKPAVEQALRSASIDPSRRAETLTVDDWLRAFRAFEVRDERDA